MIFLIAFWISLVIAIILILINLRIKDKKLNFLSGLFVFMQFLFMIISIITKDPIFEAIGLPKEYEWITGLFLSGFTLWLFYLSPLKNRVIEVEKETREIKTDVKNIKEDTTIIKNKLIQECEIKPKKH